mmetsp:Transcript_4718/g.11318  ORF Transcript_4718/g.11318 Transcript_4718/m.11318 type:complete len:247 (+) Transcript_4718:234-974(+)
MKQKPAGDRQSDAFLELVSKAVLLVLLRHDFAHVVLELVSVQVLGRILPAAKIKNDMAPFRSVSHARLDVLDPSNHVLFGVVVALHLHDRTGLNLLPPVVHRRQVIEKRSSGRYDPSTFVNARAPLLVLGLSRNLNLRPPEKRFCPGDALSPVPLEREAPVVFRGPFHDFLAVIVFQLPQRLSEGEDRPLVLAPPLLEVIGHLRSDVPLVDVDRQAGAEEDHPDHPIERLDNGFDVNLRPVRHPRP